MKKVLIGLLSLSILFASCKHNTPDNPGANNGSAAASPTAKILSVDIKDAKALAATEGSGNRSAARASLDDDVLLKIMADGTAKSVISISDKYESYLATVNSIYQPRDPSQKDVYILFNSDSQFYNWNAQKEEDRELYMSQLICVHEDGTFSDVLYPEGKRDNNNWKSIWTSDNQDSLFFDDTGHMFYLCNESSGNRYTQMIYRYDPTSGESIQLVPSVPNTSYQKVAISKDGNWIFVEGYRWASNNNTYFLRAIPVDDPDSYVNLYYASNGWNNGDWFYNEKTGNIIVADGNCIAKYLRKTDNSYSKDAKVDIWNVSPTYVSVYDVMDYEYSYNGTIYSFILEKEAIMEKFRSYCGFHDIDFRVDVLAKENGLEILNITKKNIDLLNWCEENNDRMKALWDSVFSDSSYLRKCLFVEGTDNPAKIFSDSLQIRNIMGDGTGDIWINGEYYDWDYEAQQGFYKTKFIKLLDSNEKLTLQTPNDMNEYKPISYVVGDRAFFFCNPLIDESGEEIGAHQIIRLASDGTISNMFDRVPNNKKIEVISYSVGGNYLYYTGVKGLNTTTARINLNTLENEILNVGRKLTNLVVLK